MTSINCLGTGVYLGLTEAVLKSCNSSGGIRGWTWMANLNHPPHMPAGTSGGVSNQQGQQISW